MSISTPGNGSAKESMQGFDWKSAHQQIGGDGLAFGETDALTPDRLQQIWERRAAMLAAAPAQEEKEGEQIELVIVQLGRELYGLEVHYVSDIRAAKQITRVPRVPDWVSGVVNLRGRILSVIDLRHFFGLAPAAQKQSNGSKATAEQQNYGSAGSLQHMPTLVITETPHMDVALLTDNVLAVEALPLSRMQAPIGTAQKIRAEYIQGVMERQNEGEATNGNPMLVVLNLPALLADERLVIHEEIL